VSCDYLEAESILNHRAVQERKEGKPFNRFPLCVLFWHGTTLSCNPLSALDDMKNFISSALFNPGDMGIKPDYYQQLFESGRDGLKRI